MLWLQEKALSRKHRTLRPAAAEWPFTEPGIFDPRMGPHPALCFLARAPLLPSAAARSMICQTSAASVWAFANLLSVHPRLPDDTLVAACGSTMDTVDGHLAALEKTIWQQYDAGCNSGVVAAQREAVHTVLNMVVQGKEAAAAECCQRLLGVRAAVERAQRDSEALAANPQQRWGVPQAAELVAELSNSQQGGIRQVLAFMGRPVRDPEDVSQTLQVFQFSQAERAKAVQVLESLAPRLHGYFSWECYEKPVGAGKRRAFYLACRKHAWGDQAAANAASARAAALRRVLQPADFAWPSTAAAEAQRFDPAPQQAAGGSLALPPTAQQSSLTAGEKAAKPLRDVGNLRPSGQQQQQQQAEPLPAMLAKRPRQAAGIGKGDPEDVENAGPAAEESGKRARQLGVPLSTAAVLPTPAAPGARPQRRGAGLPR